METELAEDPSFWGEGIYEGLLVAWLQCRLLLAIWPARAGQKKKKKLLKFLE